MSIKRKRKQKRNVKAMIVRFLYRLLNKKKEKEAAFLRRIAKNKQQLGGLARVTLGMVPYYKGEGIPEQTELMVKDRIYSATYKVDDRYRRYIKSTEFGRYSWNTKVEHWIQYGINLAKCLPYFDFEETKLIVRLTDSGHLAAHRDDHGYLILNNVFMISRRKNYISSYYLLAVLNSRFIDWFFGKRLQAKSTNSFGATLIRIPIVMSSRNDPATNQRIYLLEENARKILGLHEDLKNTMEAESLAKIEHEISAIDKEIDRLVYGLYGLSEEEIKVVEGK